LRQGGFPAKLEGLRAKHKLTRIKTWGGTLMKRAVFGALLGFFLSLPAVAQTSHQARGENPLASWLRNAYTTNRNYIAKSAEKVPEEFYNMRPGPQAEVRTFGQIIGHLANFNYLWCAEAKGEPNPNEGNDFEKVTAKADLVKALNGAQTYCDVVYAALTDASGIEMIQVTRPNGQRNQLPRASRLILNYAHNNEHYGNLVTYMRIKGIVPPSSNQP
jgi:uncharacterized damage-inducible protein DinB